VEELGGRLLASITESFIEPIAGHDHDEEANYGTHDDDAHHPDADTERYADGPADNSRADDGRADDGPDNRGADNGTDNKHLTLATLIATAASCDHPPQRRVNR
jgi:hypothetical protein